MESNEGAKISYQLCYKDHKDLRFNVRIDRIISFDQDGLSHIYQSKIDVFIVLRRLYFITWDSGECQYFNAYLRKDSKCAYVSKNCT